ncbi:DUF4330 domain-containing protein [Tyzzerella sp. OttesenSCG-928-J15]|nr:DUF4330 domain-containing protein [Tyzzerella sp. OttesenSCG-928-J15]
MLIDDKGRLFGKVSLIDIFVLITLALVFMVVYFNIGTNSKAAISESDRPIRITFYKEALENFTVDALEIGARVENDTNGTFMGNITDIEIGESINYMPDVNGKEVASPMEGYSSVKITTEVTGKLSEGAALLNGNLYGNGSQIIIWAGKAKIQLYISDISPLD